MLLGFWFRPPRILLLSFLAVTVLPASALFWLSWRFFDQDRALASEHLRERREQAADLIVVALQQALAATEHRLELPVSDPPQGTVTVVFEGDRMEAKPKLLYYPAVRAGNSAPAQLFDRGEELEYQRQNYDGAIAAFRELTQSADVAARAGAYLRIARNLRKAGKPVLALAEYESLAKCRGAFLDGVPADLIARRARIALLQQLNRDAEYRAGTAALISDLETGYWDLTRATFLNYAGQVGLHPLPQSLAFADAVEWLWNKRKQAASGREYLDLEGQSLTLLWGGERALIAGPGYVDRYWLTPLDPLLKSQSVRLSLAHDTSPSGSAASATVRAAAATGLPWLLRVSSADPAADLREYQARRRFLLTGLGLLAALVCAGTYLIAHAVNRELAAARLQSDFVSAVSHEFRTPLTLLRQIHEGLTEGRVADDTERQEFYAAQGRATERLYRLVETLLDFGRIEAGAKPYRPHLLDAGRLVDSVVSEFQKEVAGAGYDVHLHIQEATPEVHADPDALTHALRNLLDNAVKYSPDQRTVWVDVGRQGEQVAIAVRDQGLGIPRGEHQQIFGKFVRGAESRIRAIKGTGIGLAIVQHIVQAHGGSIDLESDPGMGSTFTILLPANNK